MDRWLGATERLLRAMCSHPLGGQLVGRASEHALPSATAAICLFFFFCLHEFNNFGDLSDSSENLFSFS